jgi:hypothetical protein
MRLTEYQQIRMREISEVPEIADYCRKKMRGLQRMYTGTELNIHIDKLLHECVRALHRQEID